MHSRKIAITLSAIAIFGLSAPPAKAAGINFGGLAGSVIGSLSDLGYISEALAKNLSFYTNLGTTLLNFLETKSLSTLTSVLPDILSKFGGSTDLAECSENGGGDCSENESVIGEAGAVDWGKIADAIEAGVDASVASSDKASDGSPGQISPGDIDKRFRPRLTVQAANTKTATWTQLQDTELNTLLGAEGQKFAKEGRDSIKKIVEESATTTADVQKLDNTQEVVKAQHKQSTLSAALQQRSLEEQFQSRVALYEGNRTENLQLGIQQKKDWYEQVGRSFERQGMNDQGDVFADYIDSSATSSPQGTGAETTEARQGAILN